MAKAYSQDLRARIQQAWAEGASTRAQLAARFDVSVSCVRDLIRRVRQTGSVAASARGGGVPRRAGVRQEQLLAGLVATRSDHTLEEYRLALAAGPDGAKVSGPTISRMLARLRLTQKKKALHADERQSERVQALRAPVARRVGGRGGARPGVHR